MSIPFDDLFQKAERGLTRFPVRTLKTRRFPRTITRRAPAHCEVRSLDGRKDGSIGGIIKTAERLVLIRELPSAKPVILLSRNYPQLQAATAG